MRRPGCFVYKSVIPPNTTIDVFAELAVVLDRAHATAALPSSVKHSGMDMILEVAPAPFSPDLFIQDIWVGDRTQLPAGGSAPIPASVFASSVEGNELQMDPGPAPRLVVSNPSAIEVTFKAWLYCTLETA